MIKKLLVLLLNVSLLAIPALASSHSEAPLISRDRFADNTDTYAFRSIEPGREGYVTLIANYIPFQQPSGGPHFFRFDDTVHYEFKIDNTGDGVEDVTYQVEFFTKIVNGDTILGQGAVNKDVVITSLKDEDYNEPQTYWVRRITTKENKVLGGGFVVPPANIGPKVTPNYEDNLAKKAIYNLNNGAGRIFAGQRDEGFYIDVGGVFDGLNLKSLGLTGGYDYTKGFNVSTIAIEVPIKDVTSSGKTPKNATDKDAVVGVWATASRRATTVINADGTRKTEGDWRQISRLGNPLVNEVVIPVGMKDTFNASTPDKDAQFAKSVLDPELGKLIPFLYGPSGIKVPTTVDAGLPAAFAGRQDLAVIFLTGIPGINKSKTFSAPSEMLRLNTAIAKSSFPNGRNLTDDVIDTALQVVAGANPLVTDKTFTGFPNNALGDGVDNNDRELMNSFPYVGLPRDGYGADVAAEPIKR